LNWSTRYEVDYGLMWDPESAVWTATDGFAYEPPARRPGGPASGTITTKNGKA
jgi:hypothetical protein